MSGLKADVGGLKVDVGDLKSQMGALNRTMIQIGWGLAGAVFASAFAAITTMVVTQL